MPCVSDPCRPNSFSPGSMSLLLLVCCAMALGPATLHGQGDPGAAGVAEVDPAGHWEGAIELPGMSLGVTVDLEGGGGGWSGSISIPDQNAVDLPLVAIQLQGNQVSFAIQGVPGDPTFNGEVSADGDTLGGGFTQGGGTFPFTLVRELSAAARARAALEELEPWILEALDDFEVPGLGIGVVVNGEVVLARGFGLRDVEAGLPVDEGTIFAIGSASKAFTTFGLAQLADEGLFDWDRPVREILPEVRFQDPEATRVVTARDLVTHRTGLPRHDLTWYGRSDYSVDLLLSNLPHLEPSRGFRERWQYNNLMYILAGHLLATLRGEDWEGVIRTRVLEPLGMSRANFWVEDSRRDPNHARPYAISGDSLTPIPFRDIRAVGPAGSINASVEDMLRWVQVHIEQGRTEDGSIISASALRELHTPQMTVAEFPTDREIGPSSYALGWFVQPYRGHYRLHHGGGIDGFTALVTLFPMDQVGIVVLTNRGGTPLPNIVTSHVADRVLGLDPRDWTSQPLAATLAATAAQRDAEDRLADERVTGTHPHHALEAYAARYHHPGYGEIEVVLAGDRLEVDYHGLRASLEHWHHEVFSAVENPEDPVLHRMKFQFESDLRGQVTALRVPMEVMVSPVRFTRLPDPRMSDPMYLARFAGTYSLGPQSFRIAVRGRELTTELPGQPLYTLDPDRDDGFSFRGLSGYSIRFETAADGRVTGATLHQPNGVFPAERVDPIDP